MVETELDECVCIRYAVFILCDGFFDMAIVVGKTCFFSFKAFVDFQNLL